VVLSYEALIAAQAKRLTNKRERNIDWPTVLTWRDDWREDTRSSREKYPNAPEGGHDPAEMWMVRGHPAPLKSVPATYADLYPPKYQVLERGEYTPHPPELSHTEWAEGYKEWAERKYDEIARDIIIARHLKPCFAENEI
jgi:hypothetical protein